MNGGREEENNKERRKEIGRKGRKEERLEGIDRGREGGREEESKEEMNE